MDICHVSNPFLHGYARVSSKEQNLDRQLIELGKYVEKQNILVEVLASMAEQERLTIRKRQRQGIDAAKSKGKHLGRPRMVVPDKFDEIYQKWKNKEITAKWAVKELGLPITSFYKLVRQKEGR